MNANPLHNNYRKCTACGYTTFDKVEYCKHVAEHIEHIAEVREIGQFPKPTDKHFRKWVSCFVQPNQIENILKYINN
jgi:hypothetical protein